MEPRIVECFDLDWMFHAGHVEGAEERTFDDRSWRAVDLPHDWSIEGPFAQAEPSGGAGGYAPCGIGWYRKSFRLPEPRPDGRVSIELDGVSADCTIWMNGLPVGRHCYGYTGFSLDVTDAVREGRNVVAVRVDNSAQPGSRWYAGSGIYRHARLLRTGGLHLLADGVAAEYAAEGDGVGTLSVRTSVRNHGGLPRRARLRAALLDSTGAEVGSSLSDAEVDASSARRTSQVIRVDAPRPWSVEAPTLYRLLLELVEEGRVADRLSIRVGLRTIAFEADRGFLLNGKRLKIRGVCLHHDGGCVGAAVPEAVLRRRLSLLKEMGCNAIRTSHNPPATELLDMCDEMGFLVMDEAFDEWRAGKEKDGDARFGYHLAFDREAEEDLRAMVRRDRCHPSIVLWSIGNEIPEQDTAEGGELARKLASIVHEEDPTRPVTSACDHIAAEPRPTHPSFLEALDVVGYNYVNRWRARTETYYEDDRVRFPRRAIIGGENVSLGGTRGDIGDDFPFPPGALGSPFTGRMVTVEQLLKFTETRDWVAGDFMWTGVDYLGESRWPRKVATCGVLDTCGFAKDGYYLYQSVWTSKPVLHLFPHWNRGEPGRIAPVFCFTNCDEVELFVNGRSFGRKGLEFPRQGMSERWAHFDRRYVHPTTADLHLSWDVPFEPGILSAVGYRLGERRCDAEVRTAGSPAAIVLEPDRATLRADRRDVAHVVCRIVDARGQTVPTADNPVALAVEGEARLLGFDNGRPDDHTDYRSPRRGAFNGLCMAIVRASGAQGAARISASSPGITSAECEIRLVAP